MMVPQRGSFDIIMAKLNFPSPPPKESMQKEEEGASLFLTPLKITGCHPLLTSYGVQNRTYLRTIITPIFQGGEEGRK